MPEFINAIDDYSDGATGTIVTPAGESVDYAVSSVNGFNTTFDTSNPYYGSLAGAGVGQGSFVDVTFSKPVSDLVVVVSGSDIYEYYAIRLNGVVVDLATLIASGDVTFSSTLANGSPGHQFVTSSGRLTSTGSYLDTSVAEIQFHIPVFSLGFQAISTTGYDVFEIGFTSATDVLCFVTGTQIKTQKGEVPVEQISVGNLVATAGNGFQPVRWIGSCKLDSIDLSANPKLFPIRIRAGALGKNTPTHDLMVSPQHSMLLRSKTAQRMFGTYEILVPAVKLLGLEGVERADDITEVEYFHILFDKHEIVFANGAPSESLLTGKQAIKSMSAESRREVMALFPEICEGDHTPEAARPIVRKNAYVAKLLERHVKNNKPLVA